jgi:hypothetical protein
MVVVVMVMAMAMAIMAIVIMMMMVVIFLLAHRRKSSQNHPTRKRPKPLCGNCGNYGCLPPWLEAEATLKAQCLQQVLFSSSHLLTQTSFLSAVSVSTRNIGDLFAQRRVQGSMTRIFHEGLSRRPGLW